MVVKEQLPVLGRVDQRGSHVRAPESAACRAQIGGGGCPPMSFYTTRGRTSTCRSGRQGTGVSCSLYGLPGRCRLRSTDRLHPGAATRQRGPTMDLLLVSGERHPHHHSTPVLADLLKAAGHRVQMTQDTNVLLSGGRRDFDALVFNYARRAEPAGARDRQPDSERFTCGGKGYFCIHLAGCRLEDWPKYRDITGKGSLAQSGAMPPHGPFAVSVYPAGRPCVRGVASFVTEDELFGFGPVGYLGHVVAFTIDDHPRCRP